MHFTRHYFCLRDVILNLLKTPVALFVVVHLKKNHDKIFNPFFKFIYERPQEPLPSV